MNSEAFLSLYLKEIGVQAPISSFLSEEETTKIDIIQVVLQSEAVAEELSYNDPDVEVNSGQDAAEVAEPQYNQRREQRTELQSEETISQEQSLTNDQSENTHVERHIEVLPEATEQAKDLTGLQNQVTACQSCELAQSKSHFVFGSGNQTADLVFIGDSPSRDDDAEGLPFSGRSGELFTRMLASINLTRDDVYLMNGVKCRPQNGRDPKPTEFVSCEHWLVSQLDFIQPRMICLFGRVVAEAMLNTQASLKELREGHHTYRGIPVVVIDHPSYLLRSQKHKQRAWKDLNRLIEQLQKLQSV